MNASHRITVVLAFGAVALTLEAACARSEGADATNDGFLPNNPAPLTACIQTECPGSWATCNGGDGLCTTDTSRDLDHCGACGTPCPQPEKSLHATPVCNKGVCAIACDALWADCNKNPVDGCEVSTSDDPKNCGGCGIACDPGEICWQGACGCPNGFTTCGSDCKNLKSDDSACGSCDGKCEAPALDSPAWTCGPGVQPPQTTWGCSAGGCTITCKDSYGNCNDNMCADGCESDLRSDAKNCGQCGHACNANQECLHGTCICPDGATRCGDRCVDTDVDIDNCGACGRVCPGASDDTANGGPTCSGGVCGYVCYAGYADCNHLVNDGCEAKIGSDPKNCGGCGIQCDTAHGQPCVLGKCLTKPCDVAEATK
jgi:hypothetical protein